MVGLCISEYHNGWNCDIKRVDYGKTRIDAHANSRISLKCSRPGTFAVRSVLMPGGRLGALCEIITPDSRKRIEVEEQTEITLAVDDEIALICESSDVGQAWYVWDLLEAEILTDRERVYHCSFSAHLGDAIAILVALENYAIHNDIAELRLVQQSAFCAVADAFEFQRIHLVQPTPSSCDVEAALRKATWRESWVRRFGLTFCNIYGGQFPQNVLFPKPRFIIPNEKTEIVLCQFDNRSTARLLQKDVDLLIKVLARDREVAVIGGPDTIPYLGDRFVYRIGDLRFIVSQLVNCRYFIGCDSGISHVAGLLGIAAYVVNAHLDFEFVSNFYREYSNIALFDRRLIKIFE